MAFEESVESLRWFLAPVAGSLLLRDEESRGGSGLIRSPVLRAAEIARARVEPHRWLAYGGWGARLGWQMVAGARPTRRRSCTAGW